MLPAVLLQFQACVALVATAEGDDVAGKGAQNFQGGCVFGFVFDERPNGPEKASGAPCGHLVGPLGDAGAGDWEVADFGGHGACFLTPCPLLVAVRAPFEKLISRQVRNGRKGIGVSKTLEPSH